MIKMLAAVAALIIAGPALGETYQIPAAVVNNTKACPKETVTAAEPSTTISGELVPAYVQIDLMTNTVKVARCTFKISGFANATGSLFGATLKGDNKPNVLTGLATDKMGAASDGIYGNGGADRISVRSATALVWGGAGIDIFNVPAPRSIKIGRKVYSQSVVLDREAGESVE